MEVRRSLATVLFTDIVSSTERAAALGDRDWRALLHRHHALVRRELARHNGREVATAGDGFLALFENSSEAIFAACGIRDAVAGLDLQIRAGLHAGQVEWEGETVEGIAVHIGARVCALAAPGEVLVSSTIHDLEVGSGFGFAARGVHALKGVPGEWRLFTVTSCPALPLRGGGVRAAQGRGVLAGALAFIGLFLLVGVYVSVVDRDSGGGRPGSEAVAPPHGVAERPLDAPASPVAVPAAAVPLAGPGAAPALLDTARSAGQAETRPPPAVPPSTPDVGDRVRPAPETAEAAAAATDAGRPRSAYDAALASADEARRIAVAAGAEGLATLRRGDAALREGISAAEHGRYAEGAISLARAARDYDRARAAAVARARAARIAEAGEAPRPAPPAAPPAPPAPPPAAPPEERPANRFPTPLAEPPRPEPEAARPVLPPAPPPAPPEAVDPDEPEETVRSALGALRAAIEAEDLSALRRTWVSLGDDQARGFDHWFEQVSDIRVRYDVASVRPSGDALVADVRTTYEFRSPASGDRERRTFQQVFELRPREGRWVVVGSRE